MTEKINKPQTVIEWRLWDIEQKEYSTIQFDSRAEARECKKTSSYASDFRVVKVKILPLI